MWWNQLLGCVGRALRAISCPLNSTPSCEAHHSRLSGNFWERQKIHVRHFSGENDSTQKSSLGLSRMCEDRKERQTGRRMWKPAKAGFGLDKLLFSWLAWIVTYYLLKCKRKFKNGDVSHNPDLPEHRQQAYGSLCTALHPKQQQHEEGNHGAYWET